MMLSEFDFSAPEISLQCENGDADAAVFTAVNGNKMELRLRAEKSRPCFVTVFWPVETAPGALVLGDAWERSYGDLRFLPLEVNDRAMPWYFMATNNTETLCFGVATQPNAFVSFRFSPDGIRAMVDCRNGAAGVELNGRELTLCTFICKTYENTEPFDCLCDFCRAMCPAPRLPEGPVFGGNDWYYAYGGNSANSVVSDARLQAELAEGCGGVPYMVVDDGWEQGDTAGPWRGNEKFGDMKAVCDRIRETGAIPGIWFRPLCTQQPGIPEEWKLARGERTFLDPSHPEVLNMLREDIARIRSWGYRLLKHDYSTCDLFGDWGSNLGDTITNETGWHFYDRKKTSAEIVLGLYRTIREAAGDMTVIGCNTVSHLCAGLVELNRTGDDTSGREWARTLKMGVNTLAFRLAQNGAFYMVDADCVGMLKDNIPWEKNRQWMELLSRSNTALFLSCCEATDGQKKDVSAAYRAAQVKHTIRPLDWMHTKIPAVWEIDGETVRFDW